MVHGDPFFELLFPSFLRPVEHLCHRRARSRPEKRMEGAENVSQFVTPPQSPAETIFGGLFGSWRHRARRERESELCSVCSAGVIRTAIMIDFVPVPTRTPLPFSISSSQAHRQLWVQMHMHNARRTCTPPPNRDSPCSLIKERVLIQLL